MKRSDNGGGGGKKTTGRRRRAARRGRSTARQTSQPTAKQDYSVGYGKPPVSPRFKQGVSGNPKGRPKGRRNCRTIAQEAFFKPVKIREGDRIRTVPWFQAAIMKQQENALKGDGKALLTCLHVAKFFGVQDEMTTEQEPTLSSADEAIIHELLARRKSSKGPSDDEHL